MTSGAPDSTRRSGPRWPAAGPGLGGTPRRARPVSEAPPGKPDARQRCHISAVILSRHASLGVIFLRAPANWTQIIKWNTTTDVFDMGQWFRGRIYERRCDLSPSGEKLIYFAAKHHLRNAHPSYTSTWTAISKIPYLTALALWPNGGTTYHGGGLFAAENTIGLNSYVHRHSNPARDLPAEAHPEHAPPPGVQIVPLVFTSGDGLFPLRLVRDGWKLTTPGDVRVDGSVIRGCLVRSSKHQPYRLRLELDHRRAKYSLTDTTAERPENDVLDGASWADWDHDGRLVFARDGRLFRMCADHSLECQLLADFRGRRPNRLSAPEWAHTW